ncbi:MAG TPA: chemotaxis response regulator protein-glutamate methylesterase [Acetobacteraceae bacterium]|nr:chemotaxis response regulator protein-glutamate methylesterase [Acetobacteraceae bacterium]
MICDDSGVIRAAIARMLDGEPGLSVVARVTNGRQALEELARQSRPGLPGIDVVVLDIEMPEMDGMTALPLLLKAAPDLRVIMASTLTTQGADIALRALRLGAADYVPKPSAATLFGDQNFRRELVAKIKGLARLRHRAVQRATVAEPVARVASTRPAPARRPRLLAIGSSTGGPQALFTLVQGLGNRLPVPVVLTQHMPPTFTAMLADHLARLNALPCAEAKDGERLAPGRIYVAPGDRHLLIRGRAGDALQAQLSTDPPENFCRPAVDPMLRSAAEACEGRVLVVMLTGMGHDGLAGTRSIVAAGGAALAQDEATSVVWGMPGAIARAGLCHAVLPLPRIAPRVLELIGSGPQ